MAEIVGRIGPNAITRLAQAAEAALGRETTRGLFNAAGLERHLAVPPQHMVPERDVTALHRVLRHRLGAAQAGRLGWEAGRLTAEYLLAHRIPLPVQWLLRILPPRPAARILLLAISRHAWTFTGSGSFRVLPGRALRLEIRGGPIALAAIPVAGDSAKAEAPACDYYAATFATLFRALVSRHARVTETHCAALGAEACVFAITWSKSRHHQPIQMPGGMAQDRQHHGQADEEGQ